jgi:hypothetical protein
MSKKNQSSIEWLIEKIDFDANARCYSQQEWYSIFQQAKGMHKEEVMTAWYDGISGGQCGNSEEYYNETFGETKN